jgi:hypothetical protein
MPVHAPIRHTANSYLIWHPNTDGVMSNPLRVLAGVDAWGDCSFMHGDYFAANQSVFNDALLSVVCCSW